ncbi:hypothetical protein ACH5RR_034444 [Cinchona calisaya]|uniref:WRKY domain-containing protein n=1 Tax=Cinchona calisaya TaxID=153742 RepID=A0ABD2YGE5_9GENT
MSNSTFLPPPEPGVATYHDTTTQKTYPTPPNYLVDNFFNYHQGFEFSEYLNLPNDQQRFIKNVEDSNSSFSSCIPQTPFTQEITSAGSSVSSIDGILNNSHMQEEGCKKVIKKRAKVDGENVIAIRTKTELEILDDGFKWRKYGKKKVKSNPNPRNYYKCSTGGCKVKKRVERDGEDPSYLVTTYEGRHNHESPRVIYCDQLPLAFSYGSWNMQSSQFY